MNESFDVVWQRICDCQQQPFVNDRGVEFNYQIDGENRLLFSSWKQLVGREFLQEAWTAMPCADYKGLPRHCKPRELIWAVLHDTRISGQVEPLSAAELKKLCR